MKKFLVSILLFSVPILFIVALYIYSFQIGSLDFYYGKISSPKQHSLIIGNSRSAQGIKPSVLNEVLFPNSDKKIYNFSFTALYSPYGPVYNESILNKIEPTTRDGIYILNVDPGAISSKAIDPNDSMLFSENNCFLANISSVSSSPNFEYIIFRQEVFYKKLFQNVFRGKGFLHKDGWLEITVPVDSLTVQKRINIKLKNNYAENYNFSLTRLNYLTELIMELKKYGKVFLVRLPMDSRILKRQENSFDNFEKLISDMAIELNVPYESYLSNAHEYSYVDGVHLTKKSAHIFSQDLAEWLIKVK